MLFGASVEFYERIELCEIRGIEVADSGNMGNFMIVGVARPLRLYMFDIALFMLNYAPVTSLPSIADKFKLRLFLEGTYLENEGYGYSVRLGRQYSSSINYEVYISERGLSLNHHNFITQLFMLATIPSLV
jgi:hypothetical protein